MQQDSMPPPRAVHEGWIVAASAALVGVTGLIDYATGVELRVYPLYFFPLGLSAWRAGRVATVGIAIACAATWLFSNQAAGMRFSHPGYLVGSVASHLISFVFIGLLVATLRRQAEGERLAARRDALTGLLNAQGFYEALYREVRRSQRYGSWLTLAYLDLDNFKEVNDTHSHAIGDQVLRCFARLLRDTCREIDVIGRLGGDEFVLYFPETSIENSATACERIRKATEAYPWHEITPGIRLTISIGLASDADGETIEEVLNAADRHLYEAKAIGRNRVQS
jgi:diguanylate cyclase (GGDEF)-like protein